MLRKLGPVATMIACTAILLLHDFFGHHHHDFQWVETPGHHHHDGALHHAHEHDAPQSNEEEGEAPSHPEGVAFSIYHHSRQSVSVEAAPNDPNPTRSVNLFAAAERAACILNENNAGFKPPEGFQSSFTKLRQPLCTAGLRAPPFILIV